MQLKTTLAHHLFIYTQPTHYASENASLPAPRMDCSTPCYGNPN
jgi:hypothetical protein